MSTTGLSGDSGLIDIHCHPLAGVDDGARTFEVSLEMCEVAASDGISHLVATPHCNFEYPYKADLCRAKLAELQAALGNSLKLFLGCDFHLSFDNIRLLGANPKLFTIHGTDYLLVEFGEQFLPDQMDRVFYDMQCTNVQPILTHPERNPVFQQRPDLLYHWVTRGCLVQVTAKSYTGGFGRRALRLSEMWLDQQLIHFFATDAHDPKYRPPILSECYQKVKGAKGQEIADLLLKQNPLSVIEGRSLPPGLQPIEPREARRKRSWFSFLRR